MWRGLVGTPGQAAGTAGTVTLPAGAIIYMIMAHASAGSATVAILGQTAIPIINGASPLVLPFNSDVLQANANNNTVVFTNTDSYAVFYVKSGNS